MADPFVRFWCRFVLPHQSLIAAGQGTVVWRGFIEPALPTFLGRSFEQACHAFVTRRLDELVPGEHAVRVGWDWDKDTEADVLAEPTDGSMRVAECNASGRPVDVEVLTRLHHYANAALRGHRRRLAVFSLSGFTDRLRAAADAEEVLLVEGARVFSSPG